MIAENPAPAQAFQSTLPRGERQTASAIWSICCKISIHAPTRGATQIVAVLRIIECISIHAPTRGATETILNNFEAAEISIHAPTRGATGYLVCHRIALWNFNPRSHEGSDGSIPRLSVNWHAFQSTLPRGERRCAIRSHACQSNFNPRSHEGSDYDESETSAAHFQFQSTLPRGERLA